MSELDSKELLQEFQEGRNESANEIFNRYVARLISLVRSRIAAKLRQRIDPEDVVQSAYRSFFIRAQKGEFLLTESGDLWRLLASITLNKLYGQAERNTALRRNLERESPRQSLAGLTAPEPSPAEVVAIGEQLTLAYDGLSPIERQVLTDFLRGDDLGAISATTKKSPRTIRRIVTEVRQKIERQLTTERLTQHDDNEAPTASDFPGLNLLSYEEFVFERLVGAGGMGKVYRAIERRTGDRVAIKALLKARQSDCRAISKFLNEAHILATLRHPNIVSFHGVGRFPGGGYFLAMSFVEGMDLQTMLAKGPLESRLAARIVRDVAVAVSHAHEKGIIHCDIKPGNVLLNQNDQAIVTDFGLAQFVAQSAHQSRIANLTGGTMGYIAPEILEHNALPTVTADVYGLGALLFALVTGHPPRQSTFQDNYDDATKEIIHVCGRCIATDPKNRFQTTDEVAGKLDGFLSCSAE